MLESIEGKRGLPRHKPPFPGAGRALRPADPDATTSRRSTGCATSSRRAPTGSPARAATGARGCARFSVSGRVKEPGVKLAPAGITARQLIDEFCGGMAEGHVFKGYLPGGASGGILPAAMADIPLDFGTLESEGCFIGSGAVVVLSDQDDMKAVALNLLRFFEDESCGQCTPCRVGTEKAVKLMTRAALGRRAAAGADPGHGRRLDLRPGPGGDEPGQAGAEALPRGSGVVTAVERLQIPADPPLAEELACRGYGRDGQSDQRANRRGRHDLYIDGDGSAWSAGQILRASRAEPQPSFSVSIADTPTVVANSLPARVVRQMSPSGDRMGIAQQGCVAGFLASRRYLDAA